MVPVAHYYLPNIWDEGVKLHVHDVTYWMEKHFLTRCSGCSIVTRTDNTVWNQNVYFLIHFKWTGWAQSENGKALLESNQAKNRWACESRGELLNIQKSSYIYTNTLLHISESPTDEGKVLIQLTNILQKRPKLINVPWWETTHSTYQENFNTFNRKINSWTLF